MNSSEHNQLWNNSSSVGVIRCDRRERREQMEVEVHLRITEWAFINLVNAETAPHAWGNLYGPVLSIWLVPRKRMAGSMTVGTGWVITRGLNLKWWWNCRPQQMVQGWNCDEQQYQVTSRVTAKCMYKLSDWDFPGVQWLRLVFPVQGARVQSLVRNEDATCPTRQWGAKKKKKISGKGNGSPRQYSCLGNSKDRGAWWATVHEVTKESDTT